MVLWSYVSNGIPALKVVKEEQLTRSRIDHQLGERIAKCKKASLKSFAKQATSS